MEIGGRLLSVTLSDVSYVPHWHEACLISCRKFDVLGGFRMVGEDGIIAVPHKYNQTQRYPQSSSSDHGGEFVIEDLEEYVKDSGNSYQQTAAYCQESNGVADHYTATLSAVLRPAHAQAPPSLLAEAYTCACYITNRLPHSALHVITPYEACYHTKLCISHLPPFYTKCYAAIDNEKSPSGSKLEPRSIEVRLLGYTDSGQMFRIYLPLKDKVNTVRQVRFEPSSYTSVDVHIPPLLSDLADDPPTIIQELRPDTPPPTTKTTTSSTQQTVPGSHPETAVHTGHAALIEVSSPPANIQAYLEVSDDDHESE